MVFKAVFALTVLLILGSSTLVGGRLLGLIGGPPETTATICDALTSTQRRALVDGRTPNADERSTEDEQSCRWTGEDKDTLVEVTTMSAAQWVVGLTSDLAGRDGPTNATSHQVRERALALGATADGRAACALASQVFELDGADRGAKQHVTFRAGDLRTSARLVAEECIAGTFTQVVAAAPDLRLSPALERRAMTALGQVQQQLS